MTDLSTLLLDETFGQVNTRVTTKTAAAEFIQGPDGKFQGSKGSGEQPTSEVLTRAAKAYQGDLEESMMVRYAAEALVTNTRNADTDGTARARELLHGIENSDPTTDALYRGMVIDKPDYKEGQMVTFALGSFSQDKSWAEGFTGSFASGVIPKTSMEAPGPVLYQLEPGARALNVDAITQPTGDRAEHEWVTGGSFEVVKTEPYGPIGSKLLGTSDGQLVTLRQTKVVDIP